MRESEKLGKGQIVMRELTVEELAELATLEMKLQWLQYGVEVTQCEIELIKNKPAIEAQNNGRG